MPLPVGDDGTASTGLRAPVPNGVTGGRVNQPAVMAEWSQHPLHEARLEPSRLTDQIIDQGPEAGRRLTHRSRWTTLAVESPRPRSLR